MKKEHDWLVALRDMGTCKAFRATDGLLEGREMQQIPGRAGALEHLLTVMVGAHPQARLAGVLRSMARQHKRPSILNTGCTGLCRTPEMLAVDAWIACCPDWLSGQD